MILGAMNCADYYYINHSNKRVCFHYNFEKRVKIKVTNFLKNNHEEAKIIKFLEQFELELLKESTSNRYIHYSIIDKKEKNYEN